MSVAENIESLQDRIQRACQRSGRAVKDVRLIAVSKTKPAEAIRQAYGAGLREFGENRVQEAAAKRHELEDLDIIWHLIGHLQSNKTKQACRLFGWVHSVDSVHLAEKIDREATALGRKMSILIEVHLGQEASKFGVEEDDLLRMAEKMATMPSLELRGLMTLPPLFDDPQDVRPFFRRLRELAERVDARKLPGVGMRELSMGMSHDFEIAIEEGATIVRVGTAIFGERQR
ncbi:MAG: YggS family pyridoxal phosphate-dependent enzyme [Acidobacteria bacterium]|nr:MAG: YggS family pyridoxal phosphate-dependent enzyme [Acidobacteriota bacterium]